MKLRNNKIVDQKANIPAFGSPLGISLTDGGRSIGDIYTSHPSKTPRNMQKILNTCVNLNAIFPENKDTPNFDPNVCISDIGHFISPPRTAKHKKYNLKNFCINLTDIMPISNVKSTNLNPKVKLSDILECSHGCVKNLNTLPDFNPKVVLKQIMFAPVEEEVEGESSCVNYVDQKKFIDRSVDALIYSCGDGKAKGIHKCKSKKCKLRDNFCPSNRVVSSSTKRVYDVIVPPGSSKLN
jgi:hypothetical protein